MFLAKCLILMFTIGLEPDPTLCKQIVETSPVPETTILVAAIESSFNPTPKVGAATDTGLMQITPIALREVQRLLPFYRKSDAPQALEFVESCYLVGTYEFSDMEKVVPNIRTGSCFLYHLSIIYGSNTNQILAHYNGGGAQVTNLLEGRPLHPITANYLVKYQTLRDRLYKYLRGAAE